MFCCDTTKMNNWTRVKVIQQTATSLFYHIRQMAALNAKFARRRCICDPWASLEKGVKGRSYSYGEGVDDSTTIRKSHGGFQLFMLSIVIIVHLRSNHSVSVAICYRMSQRWNQEGVSATVMEEGVDRCQILTWSQTYMELSYAKEIVSISSLCFLAIINERGTWHWQTDRQTNRPQNGKIDRNRRNRLSSVRCRLIKLGLYIKKPHNSSLFVCSVA